MNNVTKGILTNVLVTMTAVLGLVVLGLVSKKWGLLGLLYVVLMGIHRALYVHSRRR